MMLHCLKYSPLAPILISFVLFGLFVKCDSSQNSQEKLSNDTKTENERTVSPFDAPKSGRQAKDKRELTASNRDSNFQPDKQRKVTKTQGNHGNQGKQPNRRQPPTGVPNRRPGNSNRNKQNGRNPPNAPRNRRPDQNDCRGKFIHRIIVRNKFPCPNPHHAANPPVNRQPYYYN